MIVIYKITNIANGKIYIGQTVNYSERVKSHKRVAFGRNARDRHKPLYKAFLKYGLNSFKFEIIETCTSYEEANFLEIFFIKKFKSTVDSGFGYNLDLGGKNGKKSEYTKSKISEAHKGYGGGSFGKRKGEAYRARKVYCIELDTSYDSLIECAEAVYGKNYSKTDLLKIGTCSNPISNRFSHKGFSFRYLDKDGTIVEKKAQPLSRGKNNRGMKIIETNTGLIFNKISECSEHFGISSSMIRDRVHGRVVCVKYNFMEYESFIANGGLLTVEAEDNPVPSYR